MICNEKALLSIRFLLRIKFWVLPTRVEPIKVIKERTHVWNITCIFTDISGTIAGSNMKKKADKTSDEIGGSRVCDEKFIRR